MPRRKSGKSASVRLAAYARGTPMGRSAPRATAPFSASCVRRDRKVVTSPTRRGALSVQPEQRRRAIVDPALARIDAPVRMGGEVSFQAGVAHAPAGGRRSRAASSVSPAWRPRRLLRLGLGFLLALLAGEPFLQAHARLGGAFLLIGTLAFAKSLGLGVFKVVPRIPNRWVLLRPHPTKWRKPSIHTRFWQAGRRRSRPA